jgi:hypothetical protein
MYHDGNDDYKYDDGEYQHQGDEGGYHDNEDEYGYGDEEHEQSHHEAPDRDSILAQIDMYLDEYEREHADHSCN